MKWISLLVALLTAASQEPVAAAEETAKIRIGYFDKRKVQSAMSLHQLLKSHFALTKDS
jgi:hypothetical protein